MNIAVISLDEPVYTFLFWQYVFGRLHSQISKVYIVKPSHKNLRNWAYEGLYQLLLCCILYQIKDIFSVLSGRSLASLAKLYQIPVVRVESVNCEVFRTDIRQLAPEIVLAQVPMRVSRESLDIPKLGWINKHFGLLGDYKGAFPFLWAYWNRESYLGVTIHWMNEHYDEGTILGQKKEALRRDDSIPSILKRLNKIAGELLVDCLGNLSRTGPSIAQQSRYFPRPSLGRLLKFLILKM